MMTPPDTDLPEGIADDLARFQTLALEAAHERGMLLPYVLVIVGVNGMILAARFTTTGEVEMLVNASGMMQLPINMMLINSNGDAARFLITKDGMTTFH